ncbi:MAG: tetratricopeptide repeat protein [Planctomycetes bacterium]|nr:tetratricopeptide repeat protein [Planctomycetota bacterium]
MSRERPRTLALACSIVVVVFAAYAGALRCGYVFDDFWCIRRNDFIQDGRNLFRFFGEEYRSGKWPDSSRPLLVLSTMADAVLFGIDRPWAFHLQSLLWHAVASVLVFLVARRWTGAEGVGWVAGLFFAVHPIHVDAVAYISSREDPLCTAFYLLGLLCIDAFAQTGSRRWLAAVCVSCALALAAKEMAATFPAAALLWMLATGGEGGQPVSRRTLIAVLAATAALTGGYLAAKFYGLPNDGTRADFITGDRGVHYASAVRVLADYWRLLVWPARLSGDYPVVILKGFSDPACLRSAALLLALLAGAILAWRRSRPWGLALLWWFVTVGPVTQIVPIFIFQSERFMYLPSVGVCVMAAMALRALVARVPSRVWGSALTALFVMVAGSVALGRTWSHVRDYRDPIALWTSVLEVFPGSQRAHNDLGDACAKAGLLSDAEFEFRAAVRLGRDSEIGRMAMSNLAFVLVRNGREEEAVELRRILGDTDPGQIGAQALNDLGVWADRRGDAVEAESKFRASVARKPDFVLGWRNLGRVLDRVGRRGEARAAWERVLELAPGDGEAERELRKP